ncbi:MAG: DUF1684 domain-containing protein [Candidatus Solibacter sp.]
MWRIVIPALAGVALLAATSYQTEIAEWRRQRVENLKKDGGWLSVAGLFWLHEGANTVGRAEGNEIVLPDGPGKAGMFEWHGGKVTVKLDGTVREVRPDSDDVVKVGRLSLYVIQRSEKMGIRLKDPDAGYRRNFKGIENYPVKEEYRVTAKWVAAPQKMPILNMIGQTEYVDSPGYAEFKLNGQNLRLRPYIEEPGDKELFYVFRDQTAAKETYGAGRFFYSPMPENGHIVLDFNKAYNPPCAFTPYATCPLPPAENKLAVRIEAGEKKYGEH